MTRTVLVTRTPADCRELAELVRPAGIRLHAFPVLRFEEVDDADGWRRALEAVPPGRHAWLLLASPRAPQRLVAQARAHGACHLLALPAAAVGEGTAAAAAAAGLCVTVTGEGTGGNLARTLIELLDEPTTLLFACGHDRRRELPETLEGAGHTVVELEVYRMRRTPPRELPPLPSALDAVILTSPRAAQLYLEGVGGLPLPCPHWALGPTTRDAAAALGIDCRVPPRPDLRSLAEELCTT